MAGLLSRLVRVSFRLVTNNSCHRERPTRDVADDGSFKLLHSFAGDGKSHLEVFSYQRIFKGSLNRNGKITVRI
jgi:hypothetical protein